LAAGFRLTNKLLGSTPKESVDRQARAAQATSKDGIIDVEAKVLPLPDKGTQPDMLPCLVAKQRCSVMVPVAFQQAQGRTDRAYCHRYHRSKATDVAM